MTIIENMMLLLPYNYFALTLVLLMVPQVGGQVGIDEDYNEVDETNPAFTLSPFTFPSVTAGGLSYNLPGNLGSGRDCFKNFPHLKRRFSPEQLEFFCQQKRLYEDIISSNGTKINPFTFQQMAWIDSLRLSPNDTKSSISKVIRKEIRKLTQKEWRRFSNAIRYMKGRTIDGVSHYDLLVMLSHPAVAPGAQVGAAFLPWHREYLRMFEVVLRRYHPENTIPYWDSTLDYPLPDPTGSMIWTPLLFGNNDGIVFKGPFRMFLFRSDNFSAGFPLKRDSGVNGSLYSPDLIEFFQSKSVYKDLTAYIDLTVEQANRKLHEWVGGSMNSIYYALQDPISLTNFAFLDYLWEEFRTNRQSPENRTYDYPPNYEAGTSFHYGGAEMKPFGPLKNIDGLSNLYTDVWYEYEPRPTCSRSNPSCYSNYLFCDTLNQRCVAKVRLGASCKQFGAVACFRGGCFDNVCQLEPPFANPTNHMASNVGSTSFTRRETDGDGPILKPTEEIGHGSAPAPPPDDDVNSAQNVSWFSPATATPPGDNKEPANVDTQLPFIDNDNILADVLSSPASMRVKPTKSSGHDINGISPPSVDQSPTSSDNDSSDGSEATTPDTAKFPHPEYPTVAGKNKTREASKEVIPDGRPKQTSEEDVDEKAGRLPLGPDGKVKPGKTTQSSTEADNKIKPDSKNENDLKDLSSTTTLFPPTRLPAGDSGEFLPDGRPKQTKEEDVGGGHKVVLPHEEGKPPVWVTPIPEFDDQTRSWT